MVYLDYEKRSIRLPKERWRHINTRHPETQGQESLVEMTLSTPDFVQEGSKGELLAIKRFKKTPISDNKFCTVVFKRGDPDGFVITVYLTRRPSFRRKLIWKK
jgi:hypothetical protein